MAAQGFLTNKQGSSHYFIRRCFYGINTRQIKKLGLGCAFLDKKAITSEGLKAAIVKLLTEPSYKETAHAFSEDMRSLGGAKASAEALLAYLKQ